MLDRHTMPISESLLGRPARALFSLGVSANQMTLIGFVLGLAAVPALAFGHYLAALAFIVLNRVADGLDGAIARIAGPTTRGAYLDIAFDFFFYASIPFGFALSDPAVNALPAAFLLLTFIGTGSSFLAFATIAAQRGLKSTHLPNKGLYYLGGLTEGTETILFLILICLVPAWFPVLAYVFGALALATTASRWIAGWHTFAEPNPVPKSVRTPARREMAASVARPAE